MATTMKEAVIAPSLLTTIEEAPVPTPKEGEVIVKVVVAGANPIDWKGADEEVAKAMHGLLKNPLHRNAGKDFAGYVHAVGPNVPNFKPGDRVISLNHSSGYAEYGVGPAFSTAHIPDDISFEEAATTGLAYITAALGLYKHLTLPTPFTPSPSNISTPLLIYGATSATGLYAVKLASLSNVHPIIAIAGSSGPSMVSELLKPEKGDVLLDYRVGAEKLREQVREVLKGKGELKLVYDSISTNETVDLLSPLLTRSSSSTPSEQPAYVVLLDGPHRQRVPAGIRTENPFAPGLWEPTDPDSPDGPESKNVVPRAFTQAFFGYLTFALQEGILKGHPFEVLSGGLGAIEGAMKGLRDGKNGGRKYLFRIGETEGL